MTIDLITLLPFSVSVLISFFNRKAGYVAALVASITFLFLSIYNYNGILSMFAIVSSLVWALTSIFSIDYDNYGKWLSPLFSLTILGMVLVLISQNYLQFLAGWEIMTIPAYVAIGLASKEYRPAFIFMAFGEFSTILILFAFLISGTLSFTTELTPLPLILATIGFMIKMGIMPFLVTEWLPIAHGTAPSNLSSILSSTMTLMGVYGILKLALLTFNIPILFSLIILISGAFSVFFGALYGYVNENIKGILAFSTIENNGAILVGLGVYMLTKQLNIQFIENISLITVVLYAFAHSIAKTGLFLSSGFQENQSISQAKKIRAIEIGLVLLASSMSGLLPNLGGIASWLLLEDVFMLSYLLHSIISIALITVGFTIAMGEGFATALLVKYTTYTSVLKRTQLKTKKTMEIPILASGIIVFTLGFILPYLLYPYRTSVSSYGILLRSVIITEANSNTFGGISPLYIIVLISIFSLITYIAFGKPKIRRTKVWNNGADHQDEYTAFGMANNIRLMLRKILKPSEKFIPYYGLDIFWEYMYKFANYIRRFGKIFAASFINSSITWYIIYIVITLIVLVSIII